MSDGGLIYELIPKVSEDIGEIGKDKTNKTQGWKFRGIDDVLNAVHGPFIKHGIFCVPRVYEVTREERETKAGGVMNYTHLLMEVRYCAKDGSSVTATVAGEAMDSADKSTNKAESAALKYAHIQTFSIPVEIEEADSVVHELVPNGTSQRQSTKATPAKPVDPPKEPTVQEKLSARLKSIGCRNVPDAEAVVRFATDSKFKTVEEYKATADTANSVLTSLDMCNATGIPDTEILTKAKECSPAASTAA